MRTSVLAMILAGGEGRRLAPLTDQRAKPAVPFGGKYRIIDFVLSNFITESPQLPQISAVTPWEILLKHSGAAMAEISEWPWASMSPGARILPFPSTTVPAAQAENSFSMAAMRPESSARQAHLRRGLPVPSASHTFLMSSFPVIVFPPCSALFCLREYKIAPHREKIKPFPGQNP